MSPTQPVDCYDLCSIYDLSDAAIEAGELARAERAAAEQRMIEAMDAAGVRAVTHNCKVYITARTIDGHSILRVFPFEKAVSVKLVTAPAPAAPCPVCESETCEGDPAPDPIDAYCARVNAELSGEGDPVRDAAAAFVATL